GDYFGGARVGASLTDADANAVQPVFARPARAEARVVLPQAGRHPRHVVALVWADAAVGAEPPRSGDAVRTADAVRNRVGVLDYPERIPAGGRQLGSSYFYRSEPGNFVRCDDGASAGGEQDHPGRSEYA